MFKSAMEKKKTIRRKLSDTREGDEVKKKVSVASSFDEEVRKISGDRGREESITRCLSQSTVVIGRGSPASWPCI